MKSNLLLHWRRFQGVGLMAVCAGVGAPSLCASASPDVLTIEDAVRIALTNNPALRASRARVDAATARAFQARKWSNPELELSAEDWPVSNGRGFSDAKQVIGVAQTLPYPGKKSLDRQIGRAGERVSEAELELRRTEVVRDVRAGFFRVLASERLAEVCTQLVEAAESSANTASKRVEAGAAAYQEQLRAEVQLEQAKTELTGFKRDVETARQALAALLGEPGLKDSLLDGALAESGDEKLLEGSGDEELSRNSSVVAAQAILDGAEVAQRRSWLEPYPDVKVALAGGRLGETDQSIIQMGFSLPIPVLDRGKGKQQEARANVRVAEAELSAAQHQLQRERANARKRYATAVDQVKSYRERILPKATEALRLVQTGFEEGKFNFIDLVDTQRTTAEVRLAYQHKLLEMNVAQAELEALARQPGRLSNRTDEPL